MTDVAGDAPPSRDIVGDTSLPAAFVFRNAENIFFRLRLDGTPAKNVGLAPFGWGAEIDTDGDFAAYEFIAMVNGGIGGVEQVEFYENTTPANDCSFADLADKSWSTYSIDTHTRVVDASSNFNGTPDSFLDWAIDVSDLENAGISTATPMRLVFGTSNNAHAIGADVVEVNGTGVCIADIISDTVTCTASGCDVGTPSNDLDGDGVVDTVDNCPGSFNTGQVNSDGDSLGDACDPDVDGDGVSNADETEAGTDVNSADSDGDGISDDLELGSDPANPPDTDNDGTIDALDPDDDGDGIPTLSEGTADTDSDGVPDYLDPGAGPSGTGDTNDDGFADDLELIGGGLAGGCACEASGGGGLLLWLVTAAAHRFFRRRRTKGATPT